MQQARPLAESVLSQIRDIKILLDKQLSIHILDGETKVMAMLPADYNPALMQIYGDGALLHESHPQQGIVTVNRLIAS